MTDKEFLEMMRTEYGIEDFSDAADMCNHLERFTRIALEISKQSGNHDDVKLLENTIGKLSASFNNFMQAYLD